MTNCSSSGSDPCLGLAGAFSALCSQSFRLGLGFLEALGRTGDAVLREGAGGGCSPGCGCSPRGFGMRRSGRSCCEIPPPCWMPVCVGEVTSHVCPGGTASVRIRIANCGVGARNVKIELAGKPEDVQDAKAVPSTLTLQSMERGFTAISFAMPADAAFHSHKELLVWVRGCKNYYLRWTISASSSGANSCHEICIEDCPDYVHRWSDHFYCHHPCPGGQAKPGGQTNQ